MFRENKRGRYRIKTPTGYSNFAGVQKKIVDSLYTFSFADDSIIRCSGNHAFLTENGFQLARTITTTNTISGKTIREIAHESGSFEVYDPVGVEDHSTYLAGGVVSHNTEFLGSVNTLINAEVLRNMVYKEATRDKNGVDIYVPPEKGHTYVITVDTARGVELDSSAFSVIDVTAIPYVQVAKYKSNTIPVILFPEVISHYGEWYNTAYVLVENNDVGLQVASTLHLDIEYENVLSTIMQGRSGQKIGGGFAGKSALGVKMSPAVKRIGCSNLKDLIESEKLLTTDFDTINELSTFVAKKKSFEAEEGCHDDVVMSLVLFGWLARQPYFRDLTNSDVRLRMIQENMKEQFDDLLPPGFMDDGRTEEPVQFDKPRQDDSGFSEG